MSSSIHWMPILWNLYDVYRKILFEQTSQLIVLQKIVLLPEGIRRLKSFISLCDPTLLWCDRVYKYILNTLFPLEQNQKFDLSAINSSQMFVPVLPFFIEDKGYVKLQKIETKEQSDILVVYDTKGLESSKVALRLSDVNLFLQELVKSISVRKEELHKIFSESNGLITAF